MTGRAAGYCAGYGVPGFMNPMPGGRGWGRGRGWRHWYWATGLPGWARAGWWGIPAAGYGPYAPPITPEQEVQTLRAQAAQLQQALEQINRRLGELESQQDQPR
jgi:hypothetical protein